MFESSQRFLLFDYFRVPYEVEPANDPIPHLAPDAGGPELAWIHPELARAAGVPGAYALGSIPLHAHVLPDGAARSLLSELPRRWRRDLPILDARGAAVASVWRSDDGSVFLPFDPDEAIRNCWSEAYLRFDRSGLSARAVSATLRAYYRLRPALPRAAQLGMRRLFSRVQRRSAFPRWPVEPALHDLYAFLFELVGELAGEPVPMLAPWPAGYAWALVLTHDVETRVGYENLQPLLRVETAAGYRSSWNFVPERDYVVDEFVLNDLRAEGFEVGVHGLRHDGRDLNSRGAFDGRLPLIQEYARRWGAAGFRSPSLHRVWEWMPRLGFEYDSSYADTVPFEPQPGGCCTWLPYENEDLVELPITLPHDHTVFEILRENDERLWLEKAYFLRDRGGMALLLTHPDYVLDGRLLDAYRRFLEAFADDTSGWKPLPRELAAWWRRRAASHLERSADGWQVVGPAAEEAAVATVGHGALVAASAA